MPVFMIIIPILAGCFFVYDSYQRYQSFNYEDVELILASLKTIEVVLNNINY
jgi:hypothetical protein